MAISEIEKLERRFAENPQGFSFAPLAEAYRKSGDPERALGILRPGLELHPDYIPASIVMGRCQLDLGRDAEAESAFAHVVALDPENVIALKALADIGERAHRFADAASRLRQLLEVDRSNEDAQGQLDRVLAAQQQFEATAGARVADDVPFLLEGNAAAFESASEAEPEAEPEPEVVSEAASEPAPVAPPDPVSAPMWVDDSSPFIAAVPPEPVAEHPAWPAMAADTEPLYVDLPPVVDIPETSDADPIFGSLLAAEPEAAEDLTVLQLGGSDEIVLEGHERSEFQLPSVADDLGGDEPGAATESLASEYQLPDASADLIVLDASVTPSEFQTPDAAAALLADATETPVVETASEFAFFAAVSMPPAEVPPIEASLSEPVSEPEAEEEPSGEWVTWSDAALDEDAPPFEVPEPEQSRLPEVTPPAELTASAEVVAAPAVEEATAVEHEESMADPELEPDLVVTESMAELFVRQGHAGDALRIYRELAGRRPGDARLVARIAELEVVEAASRAHSTPYAARVSGGASVRDVMRSILAARPGDRVPPSMAPAPEATARPAEPTRPAQDSISLSDVFGEEGGASPPAYRAPRAPSTDKGVSFDEFFGAPAEPHASGVRPRGPRPPADDLDQFHSWLQNLKR
ncbi:MAG TPA: tetratricopeptide repeat protein [Gemmatimonadales bacterium]|nr:tetratricopeptide repeat protein [Gemmatimonadales bacterium]